MNRPWSRYSVLSGVAILIGIALVGVAGCKEKVDETAVVEPLPTSLPSALPDLPALPPVPALAPETVIVTVDGKEIREKQLQQAMRQMARGMGAPLEMLPPEALAMLRSRTEEQLVTRALLGSHAASKGFKPEPAEVEETMKQLTARLPEGKTEADLQTLLGLPPADIKAELAIDLAVSKMFEGFEAEVKPTDDEVKTFFEANVDRFTTPAQLSASHILFMVSSDTAPEKVAEIEKKAKEIVTEARKGDAKAFAALADKHSEDPSAKQNHGDMGFFEAERMVPEFATAAAALKPDEVSDPVRSQFGFHIIRGQKGREAGKRKLGEVREQIAQDLMRKQVGERVEQLVAELRSKAKIVPNPAARLPDPPPNPGLPPLGEPVVPAPPPTPTPGSAPPVPAPAAP